ncbi:MAG TPA: hypothetical protein VNM66_08625, partial [Thermodesulfobacteriota bacterium]|nr:hypothetical protein [Thermodesulfobacteriota bacterium]
GAARYAADRAAVEKAPVRLRFDFAGRAYRVEVAAGDQWVPDRGPLGQAVRLPAGVRIAAVETRGGGRQVDGEASIEFYPKGYAERGVVQLALDRDRVYTVEIRPFDLRPRLHPGAVSLRELDARAGPLGASLRR